MVLDYYNLQEQPFGATPDSRYLFLSPTHKDALQSLVYAVEAGCGFVALIATPGLGKTTLLFHALHILRDKARIVFLFQTIRTPWDLLRALLSGLGERDLQGSLVEMQLKLKDLLVEQYRLGKRVLLVIDEAQNLDDSLLELVRMLSNYETMRDKLIQIVLAGHPLLANKIGSPELVQLRQRVSKFIGLKPLTAEETVLYIAHRLRAAGSRSDISVFTKEALALAALSSEGIPRNINNLCFNALSLGCALQRKQIDQDVIRMVIADLDLGSWETKGSAARQSGEHGSLKAPAILSLADPPPKTPAIFSLAEAEPMFAGWFRRVVVAAGIVLTLSGTLFESHRWLTRPYVSEPGSTAVVQPEPVASAQPDPGTSAEPAPASLPHPDARAATLPDPSSRPDNQAPSAIAETPSPSSADFTETSVTPEGIVLVTPGQTLLGICVQNFRSCTPEILQQIHELNPSLNNPDHIESGQKIRVPVVAAESSGFERPRNRSDEKSAHE